MARILIAGGRKLLRGFTLIELLVVLAIIAVLAGVAVPSYLGYKARARNGAASGDAGAYRIAQEAVFTQFGAYSATLSCLCGFGYGPQVVQGSAVSMQALAVGKVVALLDHTAKFFHPEGDTSFVTTQGGVFPGKVCGAPDCGTVLGGSIWPVSGPAVGASNACLTAPCPPNPYGCPPPGQQGIGCPVGCGAAAGKAC